MSEAYTLSNEKNLVIAGEIDSSSTGQILQHLSGLEDETYPIIWLNTEGGCTQNTIEICRMIEKRGDVVVIAFGECMSSGVLILCSAAYAYSTRTCDIMVHHGSETNETLEDKRRHNRQLKWMRNLIKNNVNVSKRSVTRWLNQDKYFTAEQALKVGLIDGILD